MYVGDPKASSLFLSIFVCYGLVVLVVENIFVDSPSEFAFFLKSTSWGSR